MLPPALPNGGIEQKKLDEAPFPSIHIIVHSRLGMARNFGWPPRRALYAEEVFLCFRSYLRSSLLFCWKD